MAIKPSEYLENKADFIQTKLNELKSEISKLQYIDKGYDIHRLLYDEKYRLEIAIKETSSNKELAELLKLSERTIYRLRKKFNL